jgi:hypothetical protein
MTWFILTQHAMSKKEFEGVWGTYGKTETNSVALSLQANYTNLATATCRQNLVPTFVYRGVSRGQRG